MRLHRRIMEYMFGLNMKHMTASNSASACASSGTVFLPESSQASRLASGNSKLSEHCLEVEIILYLPTNLCAYVLSV